MYDVLMWILEWKLLFIAPLYTIPVIMIFFIKETYIKTPPPDDLCKVFGLYCLCGVIYGILIFDGGFSICSLLINEFQDSPGIIIIIFAINSIFAFIFFYSVYMFITFHCKGLFFAKFMLIFFAPFCVVRYIAAYFITSLFSKSKFNIDVYSHMDLLHIFIVYSVISIPWVIYFIWTSKVKEFWQEVHSQCNV